MVLEHLRYENGFSFLCYFKGVRTDPGAVRPTLAETSSAPLKKESPAQEKAKAKTLPAEKISLFDDAGKRTYSSTFITHP